MTIKFVSLSIAHYNKAHQQKYIKNSDSGCQFVTYDFITFHVGIISIIEKEINLSFNIKKLT